MIPPPELQIYYTENNRSLTPSCLDYYLGQLPLAEQQKIQSYKQEEDRRATLLGKALLMLYATDRGITVDWRRMNRNAYGKPFIGTYPGLTDFNIAHSGSFVVMAVSTHTPVGIDIEQVRPLLVADFESFFTTQEWLTIRDSDQPQEQFFTGWCIKEAVIKAAGKGFSIPLPDVHIGERYAYIGTERYAYEIVNFREGYRLVVAAPQSLVPAIELFDQTSRFDWV